MSQQALHSLETGACACFPGKDRNW